MVPLDTDVFAICFALDDWNSFNDVETLWVPEIRQHRPQADLMLVGEVLI